MNPRVLELIKNPKNIQLEDLGLLKEEIHAFPYIQNIRALHLYGVHLYEKENYQKELSTTAAYTTDKKILYQLINGKIIRELKPETIVVPEPAKTVEKTALSAYKNSKVFPIKREEEVSSEKNIQEESACVLPNSQDIKTVYVNGERNRILFEGEENFLEEENSETIDIESTLESGTLVTQKTEPVTEPVIEKENTQAEIEENAGEDFTPEIVIDEDKITSASEEAKVEKEENISFQEVEPILPEVAIEEEGKEEPTEAEPVVEKEDVQAEVEENAGENFTSETVIDEDKITSVSEDVKVEEEENASFQEVEPILPEVAIEEEGKEEPEAVEPVAENEDIPVAEAEGSDAEVSFHGTEAFLPDVKIETNNEEITESAEISQPNVNKHEEEMRRLIEEVEKKMKETKSVPQEEKEEAESVPDHEISFAETQSFHFWSTSEESPVSETTNTETVQEENIEIQPSVEAEEPEAVVEEVSEAEIQSAWKPMSVESHIPDSLISKSAEAPVQSPVVAVQEETPVTAEETVEAEHQEEETEEVISLEETLPVVEESTGEAELAQNTQNIAETTDVSALKDEEVPVMNVSFFGTDISTLRVEEKNEERKEEKPVEEEQKTAMKNTTQSPADSNVPGFINTWQSWLKIDRTEDVEKEKAEIKEKAIETFIENNPRISQLKEESSYVVKEKNDDISHLMTETLANLYFEQKLYSKAVKAFEILKKKYPEKADYFNAKIKDVNDGKSGK